MERVPSLFLLPFARVRVRKPLCALSSFPYWKSPWSTVAVVAQSISSLGMIRGLLLPNFHVKGIQLSREKNWVVLWSGCFILPPWNTSRCWSTLWCHSPSQGFPRGGRRVRRKGSWWSCGKGLNHRKSWFLEEGNHIISKTTMSQFDGIWYSLQNIKASFPVNLF